MEVKRDICLNRLKSRERNGLVKVITDLRRCGKSDLLFNLFRDDLISRGVKEDPIIEMAFDSFENRKFRDPDVLYPRLKEQIRYDGETHYLLLDEVQVPGEFESVLNSFIRIFV